MSLQSLFHTLNPCFDPLKPNSEQENPRIDRWIRSDAVSSVSNRCNLDMCTEALGFESGAMCFDHEFQIESGRKKKSPEKQRSSAAMEFPPPLTTLRKEGRMVLRRKREEGRVLLIGFRPVVLEAERSGGRLVLRIPAKEDLKKRGEEEEDKGETEEKEELVVRYGCRGKYGNVAAMFSSDAFLLVT